MHPLINHIHVAASGDLQAFARFVGCPERSEAQQIEQLKTQQFFCYLFCGT